MQEGRRGLFLTLLGLAVATPALAEPALGEATLVQYREGYGQRRRRRRCWVERRRFIGRDGRPHTRAVEVCR